MVSLPKDLVEHKEKFQEENDIPTLADGTRELIKETPIETLYEYGSPKIAVLCQKKLAEYNLLACAVRVKIMGASPVANQVASKVAQLIEQYVKGLAYFPKTDENLDFDLFGEMEKLDKDVPACLQIVKETKGIIDNTANTIKDLFSLDASQAELLQEIMNSLSKNAKELSQTLQDGIDTTLLALEKAMKLFDEVFSLVQNAIQRVLFILFDGFNELLTATQLGENLKKLKEAKSCLESYCKPIVPYMVDLNDFLPDFVVKLPIDQITCEFRPYKLDLYKDQYENLGTPEAMDTLKDMDADYIEYNRLRESKVEEYAKKFDIAGAI